VLFLSTDYADFTDRGNASSTDYADFTDRGNASSTDYADFTDYGQLWIVSYWMLHTFE